MNRAHLMARNSTRNVFNISNIDGDLNSLNTLDYNIKKITLLKKLNDKNTISMDKVKILNFFCNKLTGIIRIPLEMENNLINNVYNSVYNLVDLPLITRLYYMRYRNEKIAFKSSLKLFDNGVRNILRPLSYFQILKYILKNSLINKNTTEDILNEFEEIFANPTISIYIKMEIADIFLLNNKTERGNEMLNIIRRRERTNINTEQKTIYDDSQNVHNTKINESVLKVSCNLIEIYGETEFKEIKENGEIKLEIQKELTDLFPQQTSIIKNVLERVQIDTSRFKYKKNFFSLYIVVANLWIFIKRHKLSEDLKIRLIEEMIDMERYCSTGHLSRFVNVIQGFTDNENLCVRISDEAQIKCVVSNILEKILLNAPDNVLDDMIEKEQGVFIDYVIARINKKIPELLIEYGDVKEHILTSVINYTKNKNITLENGLLKF